MKTFINPEELARPKGYTHVVIATGSTTIHISGQVSYSTDGAIVGKGDLRAQTTQVYENLGKALKAAGASYGDIVKTTLLIRDMDAEKVAIIREVRARYLAGDHPPSSTLISVPSLIHPDLLLEVEATAVID